MVCVVSDGEVDDAGTIDVQVSRTLERDGPKGPSWSVGVWSQRSPSRWNGVRSVTSVELIERAAGWPRLAVVERVIVPFGGTPAALPGRDLTLRSGNHVNPWTRFTLALMPIWPGFGVNVVVIGLGWFVLIRGARLVRALRRRRAGLCSACGYEIVGLKSGVCPECGSAEKGM